MTGDPTGTTTTPEPELPQRLKFVKGKAVPQFPGECEPHTPHPLGQAEHLEWQGRMARTHDQRQCGGCGLWAIWEPKPPAGGRAPAGRLLTSKPGQGRRDGATVDLAEYADNPEYAAMIDARRGAADEVVLRGDEVHRALDAARAEGVANERERIRQLAIEHNTVADPCYDDQPFEKLLDEPVRGAADGELPPSLADALKASLSDRAAGRDAADRPPA